MWVPALNGGGSFSDFLYISVERSWVLERCLHGLSPFLGRINRAEHQFGSFLSVLLPATEATRSGSLTASEPARHSYYLISFLGYVQYLWYKEDSSHEDKYTEKW